MFQDVFRIKADKPLTEELLYKYIGYNAERITRHYKPLQRAYYTDYSIFHADNKEPWKPDNRIAVNFAKYITDTQNGFFLGIPVKVTSPDDAVNAYVELLDKYNDLDDQNAELAKMCKIYGRAYEMYYVDDYGNIGIAILDPMESFMIYDESILCNPMYFVRTYKDSEGIVHGSVSDSTTVHYFDINPTLKFRPEFDKLHGFDGVPAVEYVENNERQGLYEPVMSMIDAYNKALSEKANDVDYFADAYLAVLGADVDNTDLQFIRDNRVINFAGQDASNLKVEFLSKPSADATQENLLDRIEDKIFEISQVCNLDDDKFGTASGIALKYKMLGMSNLAKNEERKFTSGMNQRYKLIFSNATVQLPADSWLNLQYKFTRNFPANELEEAQIAAQLSGIVSQETQLSVLSIVDNPKEEIDRINEENGLDTEGFSISRTAAEEDNADNTNAT